MEWEPYGKAKRKVKSKCLKAKEEACNFASQPWNFGWLD